MLNITITDTTPANMLRAIKAACDELLGNSTQALTIHVDKQSIAAAVEAVELDEQVRRTPEEMAAVVAGTLIVPTPDYKEVQPDGSVHDINPADISEAALTNTCVEFDLDSAGQPWNADLHSSSRAKISDGTWKKRRVGKGGPAESYATVVPDVECDFSVTASALAVNGVVVAPPPVPPLPPADTMKRIFALITAQVCTLNDVLAAAAEHGIKDLGQNGLTGASAEVQLAVLRKLEGK